MKVRKILVGALILALAAPMFQSCKKGDEDPGLSLKSRKGRLAGEWTVNTFEETTTDITNYTEDADATVVDELIKEEKTTTTSWDESSFSMTETTTETFDGDGKIWVETASGWEEKSGHSQDISTVTASSGTVTFEDKQYYSGGNTSESNTATYTASVTQTITFSKDGTFEMTTSNAMSYAQDDTDDSAYDVEYGGSENTDETITGTWAFLGAAKSEEWKNKERVALWFDATEGTQVNTDHQIYTDKDGTDGFDYADLSTTDTETDAYSNTSNTSEPDMVWELVMLKSKEMKVVYSTDWSRSGTVTNVDEDYDWGDMKVITTTSTSTYSSSGSSSVSMSLSKN